MSSTNTNNPPSSSNSNDNEGDDTENEPLFDAIAGIGFAGFTGDNNNNLEEDAEEQAIMNEPLEVDYGSDSDESGRLSNDDADEYGGAGSISSSIHSEKYSAELSKRTASLIDNFRDYVSKIDDNDKDVEKGVATTLLKPSSSSGNNKNKNNKFGMSRRGKSPGRSRNNNNQKNNDDKDYDTPIIIKGDVNWYGKDGILRDFNTTNINEEGDYDLSGGSGYYDQYCKGNHNRRNYMGRYGILQSRRVKRGIGLFAIAVVLIGVIYGSTNNNKENLPDWDEELDEIMEEEEIEYEMEQNKEHENNFLDGKVGVGSIMAPGTLPQPGDQPQHDVTSDVPQQQSQSQPQPQLSDKPSDSTANNMISDVLSHANSMATAAANNNNHNGNNFVSETGHGPSNKYLEMAQKYHPIWYSRSSSPTNNNNNGVPSYTGTNYNDALLFCAQQNERIPCPYDAICPEGPDNVPAGGYRESYQVSSPDGTSKGGTSEGVTQWAPIIDHVNSWVQVSSNDNNGCMLYTLLHDGHNPSWGAIQPRGEDVIVGTEGDKEILNEEGTRFILCCVSVADSAEEELDHLEADLALNEAEGKLSMEEADEILAEAEEKKEEVVSSDDNMEEGANYKPSDETLELMKEEEDILHEIDNDQQPVSEILTKAEDEDKEPIPVPLSDTEYSHVERYEPIWYYRNTGWDGQTYQEAVNFCNNDLHDGESALCPYEVVCPSGPKQQPFGGDIEEKEPINNNGDDSTSISTQWVALADTRNDWVQVSPGEGMCETYMSLNLEEPLWGLSDHEEITRHILCCRKSPLGEENDAETEGIQEWEDDDDDAAPLPDSYDGAKPLEELDNSEESIVNEMNKHPISESVIATEQAHAMEHEPIWYYRANGWEGQSYQDAVVFCSKDPLRETGSGTLCPYEVLCPSGPNFYPFGGEIDEKEPISNTDSDPMLSTQWVAVSDSKNDWVQVSPGKGMCQTYMSLHLEDPLWGLSGKENEQTTRHILCCRTMPDSADEDSSNESVASVAEESIPEPPSTTTMEEVVNDVPLFVQYEPLWYYRNNGWEGQTYQDAINFCSMDLHEYGEGALCPYEVICPTGPKQRPFGGVIEEKEQIYGKTSISTQWVALADSRNDWVQVSPGEGMCETYMSLNLEDPLWGLSGKENEGITRHILCCRKTPLVNDNGSVTESKVDDIPKPTTNDAPPSNNEMSVPTNNVTPKLYQPVWYNRESGWKGYTYDAATDFCFALGAGHQLCPYEVICPLGEAKTPYGGGFDSSGSIWTPTSDSYNDWVQISNSLHARSKPCMTYSALHSGPPTWGVIYDGSDSTLHVENLLCCRNVDSESSEVATATTTATTLKPTSRPTPLPAPTPTIPNSVPTEQTSIMAKELAHIYQQIPDKYQATGFGRYQGWLGQTYLEGQNYCSKNMGASHEPCSYDVLCPRGIGDEASGDIDTDIWAPVFDMYSEKSWVGLRKGGYCEKHTSILEFEDVTRYILCCKRDVDLAVSSTQLSPISATTTDSVPTADKEAAEFHNNKHEHNPESFDRVQWSGQTYSEALLFCAEQNGKIPCPYDAICPSGRGNPPVGGKRDGQAGDWAPIMDTANGWVQIGRRDTCTKYNDMKPHPPEWGLTGEGNEAITRNIICCDEPADPSLSLESAPAVVSEPQTKAEEMILDTMHPIWFERKHGYHGTTHEEAELFCKTVGDLHLCPVQAYCPNGAHAEKPLFLHKRLFQGEQWAPVSEYNNNDVDLGNNWVMVGNKYGDRSSCAQYETLNGDMSPPWTADGSQTELKQHILCCMKQSDLKEDMDAVKDFNPIWMDKSHGWNGGSYSDGEKFCEGLDKKLCPYSAYCPHGPGMRPNGGHISDFNDEGIQWSPVYGEVNHWVMIGRKYGNSATTCYTHDQLEGVPPEWGLTRGKADLKLHIQCCSF